MSESKARLEPAIRKCLAPALREDGFVGSGRRFRRIGGEFITIVHIQGSRWGGSFAINLGIHPASVPLSLGNLPDLMTVRDVDCAFTRRLSESEASPILDKWWDHDLSTESMDTAIRLATAVYMTVGRKVLSIMIGPDSPFLSITPTQFDEGQFQFLGFSSTKVHMARSFAYMRRAVGDFEACRAFAKVGLASMKWGTGFRKELEELAQ